MPIQHPPDHDNADFVKRLTELLAERDETPDTRGLKARFARRYKTSQPTVSAWFAGDNMPSPERVLEMADDYGANFVWLYFGRGPRHPRADAKPGEVDIELLSAAIERTRDGERSSKRVLSARRFARAASIIYDALVTDTATSTSNVIQIIRAAQ